MKNGLSFVLALAVIAVLGAGVLLLTGRYTYGEALTGGFCAAVGGALGPIVAAWLRKLFRRKR